MKNLYTTPGLFQIKPVQYRKLLMLAMAMVGSLLFVSEANAQQQQVVFQAAASQSDGGNGNTITIPNYNTPTGDDRLLVVTTMNTANNNMTVSSVTYGVTALIFETRAQNNSTAANSEIWYLVNPPVGNADLVVTPIFAFYHICILSQVYLMTRRGWI